MTDEKIFRERAAGYMVCYSHVCTKQAVCLRRKLAGYIPETQENNLSVNLNYKDVETAQCPLFKNAEKVPMAVGMIHLLDTVPYDTARHIKRHLITELGRKRFYAYRNGSQPIPPHVQQRIADVFRENGYGEAPLFDAYTEDYEF